MTLAQIKTYLNTRINATQFLTLSDQNLTKYMETSLNLLNTYYKFEDYFHQDTKIMIVGQEMLFLFNSNIDLNLFYEYNGLTSFNVGGAIQGSVNVNATAPKFSSYVKALLTANEIEQKVNDPDADIFSTFSKV